MGKSQDAQRQVTGELLDGEPDLHDLERLAEWMDSKFQIPGLPIRFGLDALLGLIPGLGDTVTTVVSLYLLQTAVQRGVSRATLARMGLNLIVDYVIGAFPVLGDLFDVYWKSNQRNVALLRRQLQEPPSRRRASWGDWAILAGVAIVLLAFLTFSLRLGYRLLVWLWG